MAKKEINLEELLNNLGPCNIWKTRDSEVWNGRLEVQETVETPSEDKIEHIWKWTDVVTADTLTELVEKLGA